MAAGRSRDDRAVTGVNVTLLWWGAGVAGVFA